jgi:hypothetical protein
MGPAQKQFTSWCLIICSTLYLGMALSQSPHLYMSNTMGRQGSSSVLDHFQYRQGIRSWSLAPYRLCIFLFLDVMPQSVYIMLAFFLRKNLSEDYFFPFCFLLKKENKVWKQHPLVTQGTTDTVRRTPTTHVYYTLHTLCHHHPSLRRTRSPVLTCLAH